MDTTPIKLTLAFDTAEEAQYVLEAYASRKAFKIPAADKPVGNGNAPAAALSTGSTPVTASGDENGDTGEHADKVDSRGVPFHPQYHNGNVTQEGAWKRRRNHDKPMADAYEAGYLGKSGNVVLQSAPVAVSGAAPSTEPAVALSASADPAPTLTARESPDGNAHLMYPGIAPQFTPEPEQYRLKWVELCHGGKVSGEHQKFIVDTFGYHPAAPEVLANDDLRRQIWVRFMDWQNGHKGF
jgi:hypothetical protein